MQKSLPQMYTQNVSFPLLTLTLSHKASLTKSKRLRDEAIPFQNSTQEQCFLLHKFKRKCKIGEYEELQVLKNPEFNEAEISNVKVTTSYL